MSKEEALLGQVLDRFSNIREVVNATKDIENYLFKLKLNKKRGIGVILEKTKSLVDSLFDHSVKVKDEFYQYYNQLSDNEKHFENSESASVVNNINESEANCDESVESLKESESSDRLLSKNNKDVEKDNSVEDNRVASTAEADKEDGERDKIDDVAETNNMETDENLIITENGLEDNSSTEENDEIINEKSNSKDTVHEDPLKDVQNTDITDNLNNNKESADNVGQHSSDVEDINEEEITKVKEEDKPFEPKIRLVDLSKLMDPKPRKSVKFDSSVIILTSSDEESKSPKKVEQNGVLKSALKNSSKKVYESEKIETKSRNKENKENVKEVSTKRTRHTRSSISYKNKGSSSDSDVQVVSAPKNRSKSNIKNQELQSKKNEDLSSDSEEDTTHKRKHSKDRKEIKSLKVSLKKVPLKDDKKSSSSDDSEPEEKKKETEKKSKKKQESDQEADLDEKESGRKSSRLSRQQKLKEKERVRLRTIFSRNSTKSGKYNYTIVSEKSKDSSDSDSESEESKKKKSSRKKKELVEEHLSDTSSLSDEENVKVKVVKQNSKKKRQKEETGHMDVVDEKFTYKVYIPLPKIECHLLKEIYMKNKEILEIKSLRNTNLSKSSKRSRKGKTKSSSSSDSDKPVIKKSKTTRPKTADPTENEQSSDDESLIPLGKETEESEEANKLEKADDVMADIVMAEMNDKEEEKKSEENTSSNSESESEENKKKEPRQRKTKKTSEEEKGDKNDKMSKSNSEEEKGKEDTDKNEKSDSDSGEETNQKENEKKSDNTGLEEEKKEDQDKEKENKSDNTDSEEEQVGKDKDNEKEKKSDNTDSEEEVGKDKDKDKKKADDTDSDEEEENKEEDKKKKSNNSDEDKDGKDKKDKKKADNTDSDEEEENKEEAEKNKSDDSDSVIEIKDKDKSDEDSDSDVKKKKDKKTWRKDKLLTTKISSTDSEEEFDKFSKRKEKSNEVDSDSETKTSSIKKKRKLKKRVKAVVSSDSDKSYSKESSDSSDEKSSSESDEKEEEEKTQKPARRRIKRTRDSSSDEEDKSTRKHIRKVLGREELSETTKQAEAEEKERKARIAEKQKKYNQIFEQQSDSTVEKVVLDYDEKEKKELLSVSKKLVKKLKPHQANGIQFMWNATFESLERAKTTKGSGCILAHCMGLGKTLQVIALTHTLLTHRETKVNKVLVVCPVNTVLNWKSEFKKWIPSCNFEVYDLVSCKKNFERQYNVKEWHDDGGVLILGYHMFRNLSNPDNKRLSKKMRDTFKEGLVDPGPDLVICDEGHLLKNEKTHLSIAMNRIKTARRIVLTGTPLQNNLKEYWCMVQFIKPNLLGTYKEYLNRFVNPIINGQYTDSTQHDILVMRKRSHVLHKLLDGVVQRRDYSVLEPYLPPKYEYVLFINLTETQVKLYKHYMEKYARQNDGSNRTSFLFKDFQQLQRICIHPRVLKDKCSERREKDDVEDEESEGSLKDFIDDGEESSEKSSSSSSSGSDSDSKSDDSDSSKKKKNKKKTHKQQKTRVTRALAASRRENNEDSDPEIVEISKEWYQEYCDGDSLDDINVSGKLFLLFQILKECEEIGDKVLVFSQSLFALNCIEYFLEKIDEATQAGTSEKVGGYTGSWSIGLDYFRLDGSSSCDNRASWCDSFNNPDNTRARLFLISTRAGGLGINLVAANRVIIFDVSWNPSHDIQSIYRVYRFGQTKPCYIYRFVTYGTMEMKIYERQVTKQAISKRVIDEQQIDRHYNQNDLLELYQCDLEPTDRPLPMVPNDVLLGELLQKYDKVLYKYHLHQSLLENKADEVLNEEERKAAWEEFENEKVLRKNTFAMSGVANYNNFSMNAHTIAAALTNIVRKDNPTWSEVQIKGIIPALVQQLQVQLADGDMTMYTRVQKELQMMQALQAQKMKEALFQQQVMRMIQQQEQQAKILGNLNVNPVQLANMRANIYNNSELLNRLAGPSSTARRPPNEVIELND